MKPLQGVKVLDLSRVLAGPYAGQILGDLGADVLKVEQKGKGDETRQWGPPFFEGTSSYYLTANRNKKSICYDFRDPSDLEKIRSLIAKADILIENFKVGKLQKFKLDYTSASKINPRLIYCSITGFGQSGPRAHEPGYDVMIQALGGLMSITGRDEQHPTKVGVAVTDLSTGLYAVIGVLAALREREHSGLGQHLDISLFETQLSMLANIGMNFLTTGSIPKPIGNRHPSIVPYGSYRAQDRSLMLTIGNDHQFAEFCDAVEATWHLDPPYRTNADRVKNRERLESLIEERLKQKCAHEWLRKFSGRDFPSGPIHNLKEAMEDAQAISRNCITTMSDQKTPCIRSPLHFSRTPIDEYRTPPKLNENSEADFNDVP